MPKSDRFPQLMPDIGRTNIRGLTLHELYTRQERNDRVMDLLYSWWEDSSCPDAYELWVQCSHLRKRLIWAIRLKRLKIYFFSLVSRNQ